MKKTFILTFILFMGLSAFAQTNILTNGGFEDGNFIKGTKNPVAGNDWYWQADQGKVPGCSVTLSTEDPKSGKTALKMSASGSIVARYNVNITKALGAVPKLKYTLSFYAKSNLNVTLNCFYFGTEIKDGVSKQAGTPGDVIKVTGDNKWRKYTVKLLAKPFSNNGEWDFTQPTVFNLGLDKQELASSLDLYIDDIELLDIK